MCALYSAGYTFRVITTLLYKYIYTSFVPPPCRPCARSRHATAAVTSSAGATLSSRPAHDASKLASDAASRTLPARATLRLLQAPSPILDCPPSRWRRLDKRTKRATQQEALPRLTSLRRLRLKAAQPATKHPREPTQVPPLHQHPAPRTASCGSGSATA